MEMAVSDTTPEHIGQSDLLQNKTESAVGLKIACRILQQRGASAVYVLIPDTPFPLRQLFYWPPSGVLPQESRKVELR